MSVYSAQSAKCFSGLAPEKRAFICIVLVEYLTDGYLYSEEKCNMGKSEILRELDFIVAT
jgi:hypothetical protein